MPTYRKTIFDLSKPGRRGYLTNETDIPYDQVLNDIPNHMLRNNPPQLPEVSENMVVRHYTNLSQKNYGVDSGMYPLGSCTMKYNPKINDAVASMEALKSLHPSWPTEQLQGILEILYHLQEYLMEVTGMDAITLEPSAGSHGELTGLMMMKQYHLDQGHHHKKKIIIPDSAHGTNPASVTMTGFEVVEVPSGIDGCIDMNALASLLDDDVAGLMLTNPNTLGLFEKDIKRISEMIHDVGGLLYYDGANMNANLGITKPSEMGFDIVHLNLHKTFSTPHGGGGPGSGPVGVVDMLSQYLPTPVIGYDHHHYFFTEPANSIGKVKQYFGNIGVLIRAYVYILSMGSDGLKKASELAVLNANYMLARLKDDYNVPFDRYCKHEFVLEGLKKPAEGVRTMDVAKRLIDLGVHPPTIYFPLIVHEALMIEPTETESKETLDEYVDLLIQIAKEAEVSPELLKNAPETSPIKRMDEVTAARKPVVKFSR